MSRRQTWTGLIGVALALVGVWGSWVPHRAAALSLSAWDLAEFVRFVPGALIPHELFYLPVWCAGVALVNLRLGKWAGRVGAALVALGLMAIILPPWPDLLNGYRAEFRWRFILGAGGMLAVLASMWLASRWRVRVLGALLVGLALLGAVPALWQYLQVRGEIEAVYGASIGWGWGLAPFLVGWGLVAATGARALVRRNDER